MAVGPVERQATILRPDLHLGAFRASLKERRTGTGAARRAKMLDSSNEVSGFFCVQDSEESMEPSREIPPRTSWLRGQARRGWAMEPDILTSERRSRSGDLLGPYETSYDLSTGYGSERVIITP